VNFLSDGSLRGGLCGAIGTNGDGIATRSFFTGNDHVRVSPRIANRVPVDALLTKGFAELRLGEGEGAGFGSVVVEGIVEARTGFGEVACGKEGNAEIVAGAETGFSLGLKLFVGTGAENADCIATAINAEFEAIGGAPRIASESRVRSLRASSATRVGRSRMNFPVRVL